jgi:hypothetical protein
MSFAALVTFRPHEATISNLIQENVRHLGAQHPHLEYNIARRPRTNQFCQATSSASLPIPLHLYWGAAEMDLNLR